MSCLSLYEQQHKVRMCELFHHISLSLNILQQENHIKLKNFHMPTSLPLIINRRLNVQLFKFYFTGSENLIVPLFSLIL